MDDLLQKRDQYAEPYLPGPRPAASGTTVRLVRMLVILGSLLALLIVPPLVKRIQYASEYGKQRARMEVALEGLQKLKVNSLPTASRWVAQAVGPSVVHIRTSARRNGDGEAADMLRPDTRPFHRQLPPEIEQIQGQGSGVIVDTDGYIVTNFHVVEGASEISVELSDGRMANGRIVGTDRLTDIAVLKIDESDLISAAWGDSEQLETGDIVWAVGSPFGLDHSVTFGIISAKGRQGMRLSGQFQDFLQTDAAVNPGNSGGPLVNIHGEVVGINTAIVGQWYRGISLAVPSRIARKVYEGLRKAGKVARGWLGVEMQSLSPVVASHLGLEEHVEGVVVSGVLRGTPADRSQLRSGDVIVQWNGQAVTNTKTLSRAVASTEIGSTAKLKLFRDGKPITVEVTIEERPAKL
ncbi:MAG: S1C family serine protease [Pirellulales bacterium]